jgi:hypothetical protein
MSFQVQRFVRRPRDARIQCRLERCNFCFIGKEFLQHLKAVLHLPIILHTERVAHPHALAVDDAQSRLGGSVMNEPRTFGYTSGRGHSCKAVLYSKLWYSLQSAQRTGEYLTARLGHLDYEVFGLRQAGLRSTISPTT